jgi:tetratricopeptide (TPR) repeat protein
MRVGRSRLLLSRLLLSRLLLTGMTLMTPGCFDESEQLDSHRERAANYLEEEKYPEAIIEYQNVLQIDPNDPAAHYGLARAYLALEDVRKAYWELAESVRLDPDNLDARLQYAQLLLFGTEENVEEAVAQASQVVEQEPERVEAYVVRGRAYQIQGQHAEALADFEKAREVAPESPLALVFLANFHRREGNRSAAEPVYQELARVDPGFRSYQSLGAFLAEDPERFEEAEAAYRKALELAEGDQRIIAIRTLSAFYYSQGRFEQVERTLRSGIEESGGDLDLIYALASFYSSRGDGARAEEMIQQAVEARPDDVKPLLVLSAYRGRSGDLEGALAAVDTALERDPGNLFSRLRRAELLVELGFREKDTARIAAGRALVDAVLARDDSNLEALVVKAKIELAESHPDKAAANLRRVLEERPQWAQAHLLLGSSLFVSGDSVEARAELKRALEIDPNLIEVRRLLARVHANLGEHNEAIEQGRQVLAELPGDVPTRILVAQSLVRKGEFDSGLEELLAIPESDRSADVHYAIGRVELLRGESGKAREHLLQAADLAPNNPEILSALLTLDLTEGRLSDSVKRIQVAVASDPDNSAITRLLGLAQVAAGSLLQAENSLRRAIELDPNNLAAYHDLGRLLARSGRRTEVLDTYERALEARSDSAVLNLVVGTLYEQMERYEEAIDHYDKAAHLDPGLGAAKNNLAYLLADRGEELDRALDLAQEAKAQLPESPNAADTLGWVLYKKGIPSAAIPYLKEAEIGLEGEEFSLGVVRHHLALAYAANGEKEKARQVADRALTDLSAWLAEQREAGTGMSEPTWMGDLRDLRATLQGGGA